MGEEGREKQGKMVCLFYKLCRWVGVVSSVDYIYAGSLVLNPRRGDVYAKVKMRPMLHGLQRPAEYKQGYRQRNPLHVTILAKGLRIRRYPGGGPPQEDSRLVSPVLARRGATNGRTDGSLGGHMPIGGQLSMLRARQREER